MSLRIHALKVGELLDFPQPMMTYLRGWNRTLDIPLIMFVIEGGEHPVVVDTGGPLDPEFVRRHHGYRYACPPEEHPSAALRRIGVDPSDVRVVVHTHLHWDHSSNNELFENAEFVVQRAELEYAVNPVAPNRAAYEIGQDVRPSWLSCLNRFRPVEGERTVAPGITVVPLPGHTPGSQGVLVNTAAGNWMIAGDCVDTYANWEGDEKLRHIPGGLFTDLVDYVRSLDRIEEYDCEVIPSHDSKVVEIGMFG